MVDKQNMRFLGYVLHQWAKKKKSPGGPIPGNFP